MPTYRTKSLRSERRSVAAAMIALGMALGLMPAGDARAAASGSIVSAAADTEDHLVRRCKMRSKAEYCYWEKIEARHASEH